MVTANSIGLSDVRVIKQLDEPSSARQSVHGVKKRSRSRAAAETRSETETEKRGHFHGGEPAN